MALGAAMLPVLAIAAAPEAGQRTVAIVPLRDGVHSEDSARALRDEIARAMAGNTAVRVLDADALARIATGESEKELAAKLAAARERAEKARAFVRRADFEKSLPEFEAARAGYVAALPAQNDGALYDLLLEYGSALLDLNRTKEAVAVFRDARALGGPAALDPKAHSPRALAAWKDAVASFKGKLGASLLVSTSPGGAKVIVDGRPIEAGPSLVQNVTDGAHLVRAELAGHAPAVVRVTATAGRTANVHLDLPRILPVGFERGVDAAASVEEVFRNALDVGESLSVDVLVLAGWVRQPGTETDRLQAMVIDVKREVLIEGAFHTASPAAATAIAQRVASHVKETPPAGIPVLRVETAP